MPLAYLKKEGAFDSSVKKEVAQHIGDVSISTVEFDVDSGTTGTTLTNVAGLVSGVLEPGTYKVEIDLSVVATANSGLKVGLKFGTPSMLTSIDVNSVAITASAIASARATTATDAASIQASTAAIIKNLITGHLVVAKAGTLQLQAAQNASHADNTTIHVGSTMKFTKITS